MSREARFVGPIDRLLFLRGLPTSGGMDSDDFARIARAAREVEFRQGELLLGSEGPIEEVHIIVSGRVRVATPGGRHLVYGPGESVGVLESLADLSPVPRAEAEIETLTLSFPQRVLMESFEENFSSLQNAIRSIARAQLQIMPKAVAGTYRSPWHERGEFTVPHRHLDIVERLVLLRKGGTFRNLGLEALALLATSMKQESWEPNTRLWEIGDPADYLLVLLEGEVDCELDDGSSFVAGPGYPLGNLETLARGERWYRPTTRGALTTLRGNHEAFFDVIEDDFDVAMEFTSAVARGTLAAIDRIAALGDGDLEMRNLIATEAML